MLLNVGTTMFQTIMARMPHLLELLVVVVVLLRQLALVVQMMGSLIVLQWLHGHGHGHQDSGKNYNLQRAKHPE